LDYKGLRALLMVHGVITLAAGIVLSIAPGLIPSAVGIHLERSAYLVAYLLAGAEFGVSIMSFGGSRLTKIDEWGMLTRSIYDNILSYMRKQNNAQVRKLAKHQVNIGSAAMQGI
jgi:hypothetical protein